MDYTYESVKVAVYDTKMSSRQLLQSSRKAGTTPPNAHFITPVKTDWPGNPNND